MESLVEKESGLMVFLAAHPWIRQGPRLLALCLALTSSLIAQTSWSNLRQSFANPPDDTRIMMRWWWFGPSITKPELLRELEQMKAAGIGGVEIATLYPQALDDPASGFHNVAYLSDEYIEDLRFAAEQARKLGLRVDITLGSGWPLGGPHIPVTESAGELRVEFVPVAVEARSVALPSLEAGEQMLQAFVVSGDGASRNFQDAKAVQRMEQGRLVLDRPQASSGTAVFFISSRTGMMVKRPAVGASGFVLDHYDPRATAAHLQAVGDRLLQAFGSTPPYAVFSDSLEDYGSDWTPNLVAEFKRRRGYDITPYLPALVGDIGPSTAAVRHDWGRTLTELADENFLQPIHAWAREHNTLFRSQTYGFPPVDLASNRYEDLPEGEGKATLLMWREFSDTRWASSAAHLFGHRVVSSETWTWLHSPAFRATPLDMKAEADLHFLQGINQLVGHGWPYSPESVPEPGWRMYAASALDAHNPWFSVMPELTRYLQRVSYALRLGEPANDVALLLPEDDVWSSFKARVHEPKPVTSAFGFDESGSNVSMDESMKKFLDDRVIPQILDAGFNLDFIDADSIDAIGIPYKVLVLPSIDRLPAATYQKVLDFARHGGIVIAIRRLPATAPGLMRREDESRRLAEISHKLFNGDVRSARFIASEEQLGATLAHSFPPDVLLSPETASVGFIHRRLAEGDLYFFANTSNVTQHVSAHFRASSEHAEFWDAYSGIVSQVADPRRIQVDLEPYGSRILVFRDKADLVGPAVSAGKFETVVHAADISAGWKVRFSSGQTSEMAILHSWTDDPSLLHFSGVATYEKAVVISVNDLAPGIKTVLDFGEGTPVPIPAPLPRFNMRAYLEGPVREVAQVYVNGRPAGSIWHPPYRLEIGSLLQPGINQVRIEVANTAINELSGQAPPDYRLLYARYGTLFVPQDMDHLAPLPSGLLGPMTLEQLQMSHH